MGGAFGAAEVGAPVPAGGSCGAAPDCGEDGVVEPAPAAGTLTQLAVATFLLRRGCLAAAGFWPDGVCAAVGAGDVGGVGVAELGAGDPLSGVCVALAGLSAGTPCCAV